MTNWGPAQLRHAGIRRALVLIALSAVALPPHAGTITYTYDPQGRLTTVTTPTDVGSDLSTSTFTYDNADNRTSLVNQYFDKTPPNPPTGLTATAAAYNSIQLSWTASTDVGGGPVASYKVYRGGSFLASASGTSYNDQSVAADTAYTYTVSAVDPSGNESAQSNSASATTPLGPDLTPPSVPTNLQGVAVSGTQINLTWTGSTDTGGSGLAGYEIFRDGGSSPIGSSTVASYSDTSLGPYTTYTYTVRAYDGAGNRSGMSNQVSVTTFDTIPPSAPGSPTFSAIGPTTATASWAAASDNAGVTNYRYSLNGGASWTAVGDTLTTNLSGLALGTQYTLYVEAGDAAGNWGPSSSGTFATSSTYTDSLALVPSEAVENNGMTQVYGYIDDGFGSMTPGTTSDGATIASLTSTINIYFNGYSYSSSESTDLEVTGIPVSPAASWLQSLTVAGTTLTGASATASCGANYCTWDWPGVVVIGNGSATVSIIHK